MLDELYSDLKCPEGEQDPDYDITLKIDTTQMPQTKKVKKSLSEEEQNAIREANEKARDERKTICDQLTSRVTQFKRDFMSAPIRKALLSAGEGNEVQACCIHYRPKEKYWILPTKPGEMTLCYSINFETPDEIALVRVMLLEYQNAMKKTKAPANVKYYDKEIPTEMQSVFSDVNIADYSNGFLTFSRLQALKPHHFLFFRILGQHSC